MTNKTIPIFFAIDNGYAPFLSVALGSAIQNCSPERHYKAIILHQDVSEKNMKKLGRLAKDNFEIEFVPMCEGLEHITDRMSNRMRFNFFTLTIYFRLFIPAMFPQYDKGIYIDSDVVVLGDLAQLFDTDIGDNYIGACADHSAYDIPVFAKYMENAVGVSPYEYINSGVLLMNLKKLREAEIDKHFLSLLTTYHFDSVAPDQDYLNALCYGKIHYLPSYWDAMPNERTPEIKNAKLVHYNLFSKPWCYDGIQYEEHFWKYASESMYSKEIYEMKEGYSEDKKKSDKENLNAMLKKAHDITLSDITFKKMFESDVKIRL